MLKALGRCRRDSTLFQFTINQLRDFTEPNHLLIQTPSHEDTRFIDLFINLGCAKANFCIVSPASRPVSQAVQRAYRSLQPFDIIKTNRVSRQDGLRAGVTQSFSGT